ncbi:MAG: hypothetical protein QOH71_1458 [Blastocatellia bacterium]|jgi:hypothetical protein|nr:hypothetical protein [Blastocatellia bacterium]
MLKSVRSPLLAVANSLRRIRQANASHFIWEQGEGENNLNSVNLLKTPTFLELRCKSWFNCAYGTPDPTVSR